MEFAIAVERYLVQRNVAYERFSFGPELGVAEVARAIGFGLDQLARVVFLHDQAGIVMAVVSAERVLDFALLRRLLARPALDLAASAVLCKNLLHCDASSVPPLAELHRVEAVVDEQLARVDGVYFGAGTGGNLIRVQSDAFQRLHAGSIWGEITREPKAIRAVPYRGRSPVAGLAPWHRSTHIHFPRKGREGRHHN